MVEVQKATVGAEYVLSTTAVVEKCGNWQSQNPRGSSPVGPARLSSQGLKPGPLEWLVSDGDLPTDPHQAPPDLQFPLLQGRRLRGVKTTLKGKIQ